MKMFFESIESKQIKNDFVFLSCQRSNMRNRSTETQLEKELSETNEKKRVSMRDWSTKRKLSTFISSQNEKFEKVCRPKTQLSTDEPATANFCNDELAKNVQKNNERDFALW